MEMEDIFSDYVPRVSDEEIRDAIFGGVTVRNPALATALAPKNLLDRYEDTPFYGRLLLGRLGNLSFDIQADGGDYAA